MLGTRTFSLSALATVVVLALTACQPGSYTSPINPGEEAGPRPALSEISWLEDPRTHIGPSTAVIESLDITPVDENPAQSLPVTVSSDELSGSLDVTIESSERILALDMSGSLAATVWALGLGDKLIGRDISSTFPGVEDLPVVTGTGHAISPESVLELSPDLIITDGTIGPIDVVLQLREAGIPVLFIRVPPGLSQPAELATRVAEALGIEDAGAQLASSLDEAISSVTDDIANRVNPETKPRMVFLYLRGGNGIYYLFGNESGAGELIEALGGIDVASEIGWVGLRPMTDEALIAANPDIILVMSGGLESVGGVDALLEVKPALALTPAGINKRIVDMADSQILSFGPRTPQVIDALARAIYSPEQ